MNQLDEKIITALRKQWGSQARIYWNDDGFVVIANNGYVSEFKRSGKTIRSGFIDNPKAALKALEAGREEGRG